MRTKTAQSTRNINTQGSALALPKGAVTEDELEYDEDFEIDPDTEFGPPLHFTVPEEEEDD